jgi:ABC-type glycerol-3-phosphate transport system permease component
LLPLYYVFLTAFTPGSKLFTQPLTYIPKEITFSRFRELFDAIPVWRYVWNTVLLSTLSTLISLLICFMGAYAIARMEFPGANLILVGLLISSMLPSVTSLIPLFQMYQDLHLLNTLHGLLILYVGSLLPITTWVLVSFLKQLPAEIEDAAKVDGAGLIRTMWQIALPLVMPAMATLFLINFIANWNEFLIPLIFAQGEDSKVVTSAIAEAGSIGSSSQYFQSWGHISAMAMIATVPIFVITLIFQRRITSGITSGALK